MPDSKNNLLTYEDAAARIGVSTITVKRLAASGRLPVIRFSHRLVRIPSSALEAALTQMTSGGPVPEKAV
jgi:excisionase family DNA binding protein